MEQPTAKPHKKKKGKTVIEFLVKLAAAIAIIIEAIRKKY